MKFLLLFCIQIAAKYYFVGYVLFDIISVYI